MSISTHSLLWFTMDWYSSVISFNSEKYLSATAAKHQIQVFAKQYLHIGESILQIFLLINISHIVTSGETSMIQGSSEAKRDFEWLIQWIMIFIWGPPLWGSCTCVPFVPWLIRPWGDPLFCGGGGVGGWYVCTIYTMVNPA